MRKVLLALVAALALNPVAQAQGSGTRLSPESVAKVRDLIERKKSMIEIESNQVEALLGDLVALKRNMQKQDDTGKIFGVVALSAIIVGFSAHLGNILAAPASRRVENALIVATLAGFVTTLGGTVALGVQAVKVEDLKVSIARLENSIDDYKAALMADKKELEGLETALGIFTDPVRGQPRIEMGERE